MKYIYLMAAATMLWFTAGAQTPMQMDSRHAERVQERDLRHKADLQYMDSVVLSRNYKFTPNTFQQQPAGSMHQIYSVLYFVTLNDDYADIDIPYIKGSIAPYYLTVMNYITTDLQGYTAVQTNDGWEISFSTNLYSVNKYTFKFTIYSVTRECVLSISSDLYPTVTYNGSIQGTY